MEIVIEKEKPETIPEKPKQDVTEVPGSSAQQQIAQEAKADNSPAPGTQPQTTASADPRTDAQKLIDDFNKSSVNPVLKKIGDEQNAKDAPLSTMHQSLIDSGIIEQWIAKILMWGFK